MKKPATNPENWKLELLPYQKQFLELMEQKLHEVMPVSEIIDLCMPQPMTGETHADYIEQFDKLTREGYGLNLVSGFYFFRTQQINQVTP